MQRARKSSKRPAQSEPPNRSSERERSITTITSAGDPRLRWFNLKKYEQTSRLTDLGWYFQIETRRHIFYTIDAFRDGRFNSAAHELLDKQITCLRRTPIATIQSIQADGLDLTDFWQLAIFLSQLEPDRGVARLRLSEAIEAIEGPLIDAEIARSKYHDLPVPSDVRDSGVRSRLAERAFAEREEWKYGPYGRRRIDDRRTFSGSTYLVRVDLSVPDAILKEQFAEILNEWRREDIAEPVPPPFPELNWKPQRAKKSSSRPWAITTNRLHKRPILPFLDLLIFEEINNCTIAPRVKAALAFGGSPNEYVELAPSRSKCRTQPDVAVKIRNLMLSVESDCLSLMDMSDLSHLKLTMRAEEELLKDLRSLNSTEFVPSRALRFMLRARLGFLFT